MPKKGRRPPAVEGGTKEPRRIPVAAQVLGREFDRALGKLLHEGLGKLLGMPTVLPLDGLRRPADLDARVVIPPNADTSRTEAAYPAAPEDGTPSPLTKVHENAMKMARASARSRAPKHEPPVPHRLCVGALAQERMHML